MVNMSMSMLSFSHILPASPPIFCRTIQHLVSLLSNIFPFLAKFNHFSVQYCGVFQYYSTYSVVFLANILLSSYSISGARSYSRYMEDKQGGSTRSERS
jgi:hypothetical protein